MVVVEYSGRLGNHLFQYAMGRLIATYLGHELEASPIPGFPETSVSITGKRVSGPDLVLKGHKILMPEILQLGRSHRILLNGYFERYEYYQPRKQEVHRWLTPEFPSDRAFNWPKADDLVAHVRVGDLRRQGRNFHRVVPYRFFAKIIRKTRWNKLYLVTDSPGDVLVKKLADNFGGTIRRSTPHEDFCFLVRSSKIIMSASTFSWWAAWLSSACEIYSPTNGIWNRWLRPEINLLVNDEDRYHYPDRWLNAYEWLVNFPGSLRYCLKSVRSKTQ